jgi:transposase
MQKSNVIGIDLAKNVIQVCVISADGELISNKAVSPKNLKEISAKTNPSIVAFEGCSACNFWSRFVQQFAHEVRIIGPRKVKAFLQGQKTDANDAIGIAIAVSQVGMVLSQLKSKDQQILQSIETSRKFIDKQLVALMNHMRAYLYQYGITTARGKKSFSQLVANILGGSFDGYSELPVSLIPPLRTMWERYEQTLKQRKDIEKQRNILMKQSQPSQRLIELEGGGEVCAAMLFCSLGNGKGFKNGRHASAYVGVTPKQFSSDGKVSMKGIDKVGGNKELRAALYLGGLSFVISLPDKPKTTKQAWLISLVQRVGIKRACIAMANKTVQTAWALIATEKQYQKTLLPC